MLTSKNQNQTQFSSFLRADLCGGTLDIWPLYLMLDNCKTLQLSLKMNTQVTLTLTPKSPHIQIKFSNKFSLNPTQPSFDQSSRPPSAQQQQAQKMFSFSSQKEFFENKDKKLSLIQAVVQFFNPSSGFQLEIFSSSPLGGGLGGSSSILVGLVKCFASKSHTFTDPNSILGSSKLSSTTDSKNSFTNAKLAKTYFDSVKMFFKRSHFATDSFASVKQTSPIDHLKMSCLKNTSNPKQFSITDSTESKHLNFLNLLSLCRDLEAQVLKAPTGLQDYLVPLLEIPPHTLNRVHFKALQPQIETKKAPQKLLDHLILIHTKIEHHSGQTNNSLIQKALKGENLSEFKECRDLCLEMEQYLLKDQFEKIPQIFKKEFEIRKKMTENFPQKVQDLIEYLYANKVLAVKQMGAGSGGSLLLWTQHKEEVKKICQKKGLPILEEF